MLLLELGIRPQTVAALNKKHIFTVDDLVRDFPREYRDYREIKNINEVKLDTYAAVTGKLSNIQKMSMKSRNQEYMMARLSQDDGTRFSVMFFSKTYLYDSFKSMEGSPVIVAGKVTKKEPFGFSICDPDVFTQMLSYTPMVYKKYGKMAGVSEEMLLRLINAYTAQVTDPIEYEARTESDGLFPINYQDAIKYVHHPSTGKEVLAGKRRVMTNDLLYFAMKLRENAPSNTESAVPLEMSQTVKNFIKSLPYELTPDQKSCIKDVVERAKRGERNNVLLQGDVGCGKTIVAAIMMMCAASSGFQSVLMAPRQVLAKQHYDEIKGYADLIGIECVFLHSGMRQKERKEILEKIASGEAQFIIGTHSCLSDDVAYENLGLIVTDEEHLFGVTQKEKLKEKAEAGVHYISMSATPIPRTMSTVMFGDSKQILTIKTKPLGRKDVITNYTSDHGGVLHFALEEIKKGHQCYVVCPAIEDDEEGMLVSVDAITEIYKNYFEPKGIKVGVVHGKLSKDKVAESIGSFVKNETQILISTTVIEVGVNVPNSTVMIIEQAERFGLASLHQLRGRVGRSSIQSYCFLISEDKENERLKTMTETNDGFKIAEADLRLRGSGNLIGTEQSGKNKYVNMMLNHPDLYMKVYDFSAKCIENGWGQKLIEMMDEHDLAQEEYDAEKAAKKKKEA